MQSKSAIRANIKTIGRRTETLRAKVQTALINIAGHAFEHGDVTLYDDLVDAASGMNRKLIVTFIHEYGFARMDVSTGKFKVNKAARKSADFDNGESVVQYLEDNAPSWWVGEDSKKSIAKALDVASRIESLAKAIEKAMADDAGLKINAASIEDAKAHLNRVLSKVA